MRRTTAGLLALALAVMTQVSAGASPRALPPPTEDRLFEADVLRHVGRGHLSEFLGASPANLQMDEAAYAVAGYSESELQAQVDRLSQFGPAGEQVIQDGTDFVAGLNARITEDTNSPDQLPAEYPALQIQPQPWPVTALVAV